MTAATVWFLVYAFAGVVPYPYNSQADCEAAAVAGALTPLPVYPQGWTGTNMPLVHQCIQAPIPVR